MSGATRLVLLPRVDPTLAEAPSSTDDPASALVLDSAARRDIGRELAAIALGGLARLLQDRAFIDRPPARDTAPSAKEVMTADEVAVYFGVDRNTVYEYANRGVIPHQRLGKRLLFHRRALVSWLSSPCRATSTRKG